MADTGTTTFSGDTTGTGIIKGFLVKMAPDGSNADSDALNLGKISVGPPYFDAVFFPLMAPALFLVGVGPFARWKSSPLPDITFCPTGGIDPEKAKTYLSLPNVVCVGGSWIMPADALASGDFARIEALAREASALRG